MILYIRDKKNNTIVDIEYFTKTYDDSSEQYLELSVSFDIEYYSMQLLNLDNDMLTQQFIADFSSINELRGWLWEVYFSMIRNSAEFYAEVLGVLRRALSEVVEKYDLIYVED